MNNPQKNRKKQNNKGRSVVGNKPVVLLVLFCLCIGGISMVSAKYIKQNATKNNSATAKEFYFTSDILDGHTHEITPMNSDGTTANVTIQLKNHIDDLRYSETEIKYKVSVTEKDAGTAQNVKIDYGEDSEADSSGYHIIAPGNIQNANITLSNLKAGKTYIVTATTDNIYKKTLTGTIKVTGADKKVYAAVNDENQYIEVTVWTTDYSGKVSLTYGDIGLLPDNTDTKMKDALAKGSTISETNWDTNISHVFRFFKTDTSKTYQINVNGEEVTVSEKE